MKLHAPNRENHRALWLWLAEHPEADKHEWPGKKTIVGLLEWGVLTLKRPHHFKNFSCFACQEVGDGVGNRLDCDHCPCDWGAIDCAMTKGLYWEWQMSVGDNKKRTRLALQIANCWK